MSGISPRLDCIPLETLQHIAAYCDRLSIWRLRAVCQHTRAGVDLALRQSLEEQSVCADPPWVPDSKFRPQAIAEAVYKLTHPHFALLWNRIDHFRTAELRYKIDMFERHLSAHPNSAKLLRKLTVEISDSDDYTGWRGIIAFAPQLEVLSLHILDAALEPYERPQARPSYVHLHMVRSFWPAVFRKSKILFPALTRLTLVVTDRIFEHLDQISGGIPELQDLTLCCNTHIFLRARQKIGERSFAKLERLTVGGHGTVLAGALDPILARSRSIRYLTVALSAQTFPSPIEELLDFGPACVHKRLIGLALYGPHAIGMLCALQTRQRTYRNFPFLPSLSVLALEVPKFYDPKAKEKNGYPLLSEDALNLPSLERLVLLDIPFFAGAEPARHQDVVNNVFTPCASFKRAEWISEYPPDPFAEDLDGEPAVLIDRDWPM